MRETAQIGPFHFSLAEVARAAVTLPRLRELLLLDGVPVLVADLIAGELLVIDHRSDLAGSDARVEFWECATFGEQPVLGLVVLCDALGGAAPASSRLDALLGEAAGQGETMRRVIACNSPRSEASSPRALQGPMPSAAIT